MADDHSGATVPDPAPSTTPLRRFMSSNWAAEPLASEAPHPAAAHFAARREALSKQFAGKTIVIPTGSLKSRSNDDDYRFRPNSNFYWLTGGTESDCTLVLTPTPSGHRAVLYMAPRSDQTTEKYFRDSSYGEMWVGPRRGLVEASAFLGVPTAAIDGLASVLGGLNAADTVVLRDVDAGIDQRVAPNAADAQLATALGMLRLVKDGFEINMLRRAIGATVKGFEDVVRSLPDAIRRGERYVEGVFNLRARTDGNDVGYGTIAAAGVHATTLHWTRNNGPVRNGDLLLLDAGVEDVELYTADVTRTIPISGRFTDEQREIYELVLAAQQAGIAAAVPGARFGDTYDAAAAVLATGLRRLGIPAVPVPNDVTDAMIVARYMPHGVSHWLGLDVHDCAAARDEAPADVLLTAGHVLTVEPGLYFKPNDLTVPEKYRNIGIRIEDDILITATGNEVLSSGLPKTVAGIEQWMAALGTAVPGRSRPSTPGLT